MDFTAVKSNLEALGYKVSCFDTAEEAADYVNRCVDGQTVGFGGSMTLQEMGLYEKMESHNHMLWHWRVPEGKNGAEILREAQTADVYVSSVNGIAETGEIINIDGNCNRVAGIMYGHRKVFLIAGENKIAPDYDRALERARNIAAPLNAKRLNRKTPCAVKADHCYNCNSPERICRGLSVLWEKPSCGEFEVVLVHENLGY
ncbi:MAG: lactate utilization protein [Thermoflexaceae bacterium]|nr:lactate utilization protein [Thermoflexaceae bacterium]